MKTTAQLLNKANGNPENLFSKTQTVLYKYHENLEILKFKLETSSNCYQRSSIFIKYD
jgi:hypothetical protein